MSFGLTKADWIHTNICTEKYRIHNLQRNPDKPVLLGHACVFMKSVVVIGDLCVTVLTFVVRTRIRFQDQPVPTHDIQPRSVTHRSKLGELTYLYCRHVFSVWKWFVLKGINVNLWNDSDLNLLTLLAERRLRSDCLTGKIMKTRSDRRARTIQKKEAIPNFKIPTLYHCHFSLCGYFK